MLLGRSTLATPPWVKGRAAIGTTSNKLYLI